MFRRRLRRDVDANPVTQPKNGGNVAETTVPPSKSQVGSPSQTKSNSSKPEENSQDGKTVKASQDEGEPTGVETTESPTQPEDVSSGKLDEIPSEPEEGTNVRKLIYMCMCWNFLFRHF